MSPDPGQRWKIAWVGLVYLVLAMLSLAFTRLSGGIALVWVPNGVLLAALAARPPRQWRPFVIACFVASFVAGLGVRHHFALSLVLSCANVAEAVLAATLLRRFNRAQRSFDTLRETMLFALLAGVVAPAVSAPVAAAVCFAFLGTSPLATVFDWWLGHGLGMLIAAPLAMTLTLPEVRDLWREHRPGETAVFAGLTALVGAVSAVVFAQTRMPLLFLPALPVLIATFRLGRLGAAAALVIVAIVGGAATATGEGPVNLVDGSRASQLQFFQFYLGVLFLMALPTAAMLTRQRKLLAQLSESEATLRILTDYSSDILIRLDRVGRIVAASASVRVLGGYDPATLIGRSPLELVEPDFHAAVHDAHLRALAAPDRVVTIEYRARRDDGVAGWFESSMRAVRDADGAVTGTVSAIRDVAHRKSVERQLRRAADTDPLTGAANRRGFLSALDALRADGGAATIALLDLDHFKGVNDRHGHPAGDVALVTVVEVCRRELRARDAVGRLGGEEFAILLADTGMAEARAICERLREAIARQIVVAPGAPAFRVTASFGLAALDAAGDGEAALVAADRALYEAKHAGRNQIATAA